mmetsp:Transcript_66761/g.130931  ORF Transcript_66761/g.130931 Transcript_66761/m.130931 type:complete len:202 (+) Transcript_66761:71-676(+)
MPHPFPFPGIRQEQNGKWRRLKQKNRSRGFLGELQGAGIILCYKFPKIAPACHIPMSSGMTRKPGRPNEPSSKFPLPPRTRPPPMLDPRRRATAASATLVSELQRVPRRAPLLSLPIASAATRRDAHASSSDRGASMTNQEPKGSSAAADSADGTRENASAAEDIDNTTPTGVPSSWRASIRRPSEVWTSTEGTLATSSNC